MADDDDDGFDYEGTDDSDPAQLAVVAALVLAHSSARQQVTQNLIQVLFAFLDDFDDWYSDAEVAELAAQLAAWTRQAQEGFADLTQQYLLAVLDEFDAAPRSPGRVELPAQLREVDPVVEFERPAVQFRFRVSEGDSEEAAAAAAKQRVKQLADMDLGLAGREASKQTLVSADRITGWRRIIRPELSRSGSCGLCVVAANQVYRTDELMPLHNGCNCTVAPITLTSDPGLTLNRQDLNVLYGAAGGTGRQGLQRVRVAVKQHGELGPVLTNGAHEFRGEPAAA